MDDAEREDILNDALELFGGEKVDESGVIMYGPLWLSVAQKVGSVVLRISSQKCVNVLTRFSSSKAKCVTDFQVVLNCLNEKRMNTGKHSSCGPTILSCTTSS